MSALHLSIPNPCHENWQQMTPHEQGRHCCSCQKTVVDFTRMSDQEVLDFMRKTTSPVCGRFNDHQLNKSYAGGRTRPSFAYAYGWSIMVGMLLLAGSTATAQLGEVVVGKVAKEDPPSKPVWTITKAIDKPSFKEMAASHAGVLPLPPLVEELMTTGVVLVDVPVATTGDVMVVEEPGIVEVCTLKPPVPVPADTIFGKVDERAAAAGNVKDHMVQDIELAPTVADTDSAVSVDPDTIFTGKVEVVVEETKAAQLKRTIREWLPAKKQITVYPNPVPAGNVIRAEAAIKQPGSYKLELLDAGGRLVHVQALQVVQSPQLFTIPTQSSWSRGIYWMRVTSGSNKHTYQAKLIIQ